MTKWKTILTFEDPFVPYPHRLYTMDEFVDLAAPGQTWIEKTYDEKAVFEVTEVYRNDYTEHRILVRFPEEDESFQFVIVEGLPLDRISYEFVE